MRVLIVTQYFWPEAFRINDLAICLKDRGHEVTVLTGLPNYPDGHYFSGYGLTGPYREQFEGVNVIRTPLIPRGQSAWQLILNYLSFATVASLLGPFVVRGSFDVILVAQFSPVTVGIPAIIQKWVRKVPILFWVQDLWPDSLSATGAVSSKRVLGLTRSLVRWIYRRCDRVLIQSQAFANSTEENGVEPAKTVYVPNWAESLYQPVTLEDDAPERQELPVGFRVMFAGNLGAAQALGTVVEAADRLREQKDLHWIILGDGRQKDWLKEEIQKRGLENHIHLLGRKPVESMPRYFALADALLVSLRRDPAFALTIPSKIQSYLACGRPILASLDGEGARIISEAQAGLTSPAEDSAALADAVQHLRACSAENRATFGLNGLAYYQQHFSRDLILDRIEETMKNVVEESSDTS